MEKETLANHLSTLGKHDFEIACRIVLTKAFNLHAINVDGSNDGGSDFINLDGTGKRSLSAYQITTQKTDIKNKAYKDAKKSIEKLGATRYYFFCTYRLSEEDSRKIENQIEQELNIRANVYYPMLIAGILIEYNLVNLLLDELGHPDLRNNFSDAIDYRQRVLHSYTLLSSDAKNLKEQIYDDTILLVLSESTCGLEKDDIISKAINILKISNTKVEKLSGRIDSLLQKSKIRKDKESGKYVLTAEMVNEINNRQSLYERELESLSAAQSDILNEYNINWTIEDARKVSCWIANTCLSKQISILNSASATLPCNFEKAFENGGIKDLKKYLIHEKHAQESDVEKIVNGFLEIASVQPLIKKISRACVYVALGGKNPLTSCRALGVKRWSDYKLLIEPTIGIPLLCSYLFSDTVNRHHDNAIKAITVSTELGIEKYISHYYIKECAGHLHMARRYNELDLDPNEMIFSKNAFVSHYFAMKRNGEKMPETYMDYLALFSPSIRIEKEYKNWIRALMTDIQSMFSEHGIRYLDFPHYDSYGLKDIEDSYSIYLENNNIEKPHNLLMNDVVTLKGLNDKCIDGENWMLLTYDNTLINVAKQYSIRGWVASPYDFIDMVDLSKPLNEMELTTLVHSVAHFSESTLSVGARIIDKIILYASDKMQNWEFKQELDNFKEEMIKDTKYSKSINYLSDIDKKTDAFLIEHGIPIEVPEDADVDVEIDDI